MRTAWGIVLVATALLTACDDTQSEDPYNYDPASGGWTLVLANDFSTAISGDGFEELLIEGDPSVDIVDGSLRYIGDSSPDDKMWLRTPYGFTDTMHQYKLYVEPGGRLEISNGQHISFSLWSLSTEAKLEADLRGDELFLAAWGDGSADDQWNAELSDDVAVDDTAFELIIEGASLIARLVDLHTGAVIASVEGTLGDLEYYGDHDIRLRCGYSGTITLDNFRIYRK